MEYRALIPPFLFLPVNDTVHDTIRCSFIGRYRSHRRSGNGTARKANRTAFFGQPSGWLFRCRLERRQKTALRPVSRRDIKRIAPCIGKGTQRKIMIGGYIQMTHVSKHIRQHGTRSDQERRNVNAVYETHGAHGLPRSCARKRERKRLIV